MAALAMTPHRACGLIEGYVEPVTDDPETETVEAWQYLIDTGIAWQLQGRIGRTAMDLIAAGVCTDATSGAR